MSLLFGVCLPSLGATDEMATRSSFYTIKRDRCFVFITAKAENSVPHKTVVTKGS
jgi:hypothetical protein